MIGDILDNISVTITFEQTTVDFKGKPEVVLCSINDFLLKEIPNISIAKKISKNYSLEDIILKFSDIIKITPEGPRIWINSKKLSDREHISLQLLANQVAYLAGKTNISSLSINELSILTSLNPKSISSRLSELQKLNYVSKQNSTQQILFKITTKGIYWLENLLVKDVN